LKRADPFAVNGKHSHRILASFGKTDETLTNDKK